MIGVMSLPARDGIFTSRLGRLLPKQVVHGFARTRNIALQTFFYQLSRRRPALDDEFGLPGDLPEKPGENPEPKKTKEETEAEKAQRESYEAERREIRDYPTGVFPDPASRLMDALARAAF